MSRLDPSTSELLYPLSAFYQENKGAATIATVLEAAELPQPYRMLLAHDRDMTGTLEAYFRQPVTLKVYSKYLEGNRLFRQVVLEGAEDHQPKEFGAICIDLSCFEGKARQIVAECSVPLGRVLREHHVAYISNPSAFLSVKPSDFVRHALNATTAPLYGRKNELCTPDGRSIAHIIEILPPLVVDKENA